MNSEMADFISVIRFTIKMLYIVFFPHIIINLTQTGLAKIHRHSTILRAALYFHQVPSKKRKFMRAEGMNNNSNCCQCF